MLEKAVCYVWVVLLDQILLVRHWSLLMKMVLKQYSDIWMFVIMITNNVMSFFIQIFVFVTLPKLMED